MNIFKKIGFNSNRQILSFLSIVLSGQIIYAAFEAFKGTYYNLMLEVFDISNTQMGFLFTLIGSAMFFYVPAGWVNNRFSVRDILFWGLFARFLSMMFILLISNDYISLMVVAAMWGLLDAIFWPAVVNGTALTAGEKNKGIGFGLLESLRRLTEVSMNSLIALAMFALGASVILFKGAMLTYTFAIIPMMFFVWKFAPADNIKMESDTDKNKQAFINLLRVLKMPKVWLAGLAALTTYWCYILLIYTVPYMQAVFNITTTQAAVFGIINTGVMGIFAGLISGFLADFVFKGASRLVTFALGITFIALLLVLLLPKAQVMIYINIILLVIFSFSIFLARGVMLAPIAEANIDRNSSGAAMSVGSFLAYASIFWGYALNGYLIDNYDPIVAYERIFSIGVCVSLFGFLCAGYLTYKIYRENKAKEAFENQTD